MFSRQCSAFMCIIPFPCSFSNTLSSSAAFQTVSMPLQLDITHFGFFFTSFLEISAVGSQSLPKSNQEWCWGAGVLCAVTPCVLPSEPPWGCAGADLSISCYSIIVHNNVVTLSVQLFAFDQDMEKETVIWEHIFFPFFFPSEEQQVVQI